MRILIAPNAMKGSLTAVRFAESIQKGLSRYSTEIETRMSPVADGGDGTGSILADQLGAFPRLYVVQNPLGISVEAPVYLAGETAIIEMADASGMKLLDNAGYSPMQGSTFGTGQLIRMAMEAGAKKIILGVGGSATVDGGIGCLTALGLQLFNRDGEKMDGIGANLNSIQRIEWTHPVDWSQVRIRIACDVKNLMTGPDGAAPVFGPQKGAGPEQVKVLEAGLANWVKILSEFTRGEWCDGQHCGAAGGIAGALQALCGAELVNGAELVLKEINFETNLNWADMVITGEGRLDTQTASGKAPSLVARMAKSMGKKVIAIVGSVEGRQELFDKCISLSNQVDSEEYSRKNAAELVEDIAYNLFRAEIRGGICIENDKPLPGC